MKRTELIKKYIEFFKSKEHREIPSASLVPENDPTVLFTTAGMHPLVPFLLGEKHPLGKRLVNVQKCIRTGDIDEVGDSYHHTFFEMMGNWSLGDYFKEDAIKMTFEFHTKILKIPLDRYAVTIFAGNENSPMDSESEKTWLSMGIAKERIAKLEDNWWGPAGTTGPCGPDTEQFYWKDNETKAPKFFDASDKRWVEIGNNVLMEFIKNDSGEYNFAKQKNIDFGGGVERTLAVFNGLDDNYLSDCFMPIIEEIEKLSDMKYGIDEKITKAMRIVADHLKAAVFIISDGVTPSNSEKGYVLRRLIRRAIRYGRLIGLRKFTKNVCAKVFEIYADYGNLKHDKQKILNEIEDEETRFNLTLEQGIKEFEKIVLNKKTIDCKSAFLLYQSYGFPIEMTSELAKEKAIDVDEDGFKRECSLHQNLSRTCSAGTFKSGLADNSEATIRLHTAIHLLNEALRCVLKDENIKQRGSNINAERARFDFNFPRKLTNEEIEKIEKWINEKIEKKLDVVREEMSAEKAMASGAQGEFDKKYPEIVSVYTIADKSEKNGWTSKEICTGPHVKNLSELGKFKIQKEESCAAGIRRIKCVLE